MSRLETYIEKRDFERTPEPAGGAPQPGLALRYSMQNHDARRLHWDLRLEWDGVLLSWAVTKGPSLDPGDKRLAVQTEDHPLDYLTFEGIIPAGNYGAGTVMLWDLGHWQPRGDVAEGLKKGHLKFALHGERMTGGWSLVRMKREGKRENWLLIKEEDEAAHQPDPVARHVTSVATRRSMEEIAQDRPDRPQPERTGATPRWRQPQLATLTENLGDPESRWHELKFDGYRALAGLGRQGLRLYTRNGHDWTEKFAQLAGPFFDLPCDTALIDGEIVVGAGLYGFGRLQKAIKLGGPFTFQAFDLLQLDGESLTSWPLTERRAALEKLLRDAPPLGPIQTSPVIEGDAGRAFRAVCENGGEGLISKRRDAPYRGGRGRAWEKVKCVRRAEFVILGWQKSDKRGRPFASLALGVQEAGRLTYVGQVGTGWDTDTMEEIAARLRPLARKTPPAEVPQAEARGMEWVAPRLVAEVRYGEMTEDGRLRHPSFLGLREDKPADEVTRETPARSLSAAATGRPRVAGVAISSADRRVFPKAEFTKLDVAEYYARAADRLLAQAADRPLSLVRLPEGLEGERFFQKHAGKGFPKAIGTVPIREKDGSTRDYIYVSDAGGLVGAAQMGTLEFHIWGARRDRLDRPDRMVFDLDPDEGLDFADVRAAAFDLRDRLEDLGLSSAPLLTGGKGVHVVVPLRRTAGWETMTLFSRTFAQLCARDEPDRYVATMSKAKRKGRIFIDWLRNERGSTAIAPWSLRARPGAPVAVPVTWDELPEMERADLYTLDTALERDPQTAPLPKAVSLTRAVVDRLSARVDGS
ncbi:DNA ligase D [Histidinibacterium lentulum]|uniref:DNA ligase (ATP) n=1 Tax=Histidinibacterium lentulum TaxID=2480588 RepID=A0A3N2R5Y6_9RHOB|nr:DNA ligase D [Histidinibacterium lentulum]ROU02905.1 DNA ligase D [Histidinibacterium lentulum]